MFSKIKITLQELTFANNSRTGDRAKLLTGACFAKTLPRIGDRQSYQLIAIDSPNLA
ncbi:hypothetical protein [Phormidium sp. CCY1219]|uniref:hypothetical protein n=1 Tax=Phormidium sp. CCY1219 TaxID=2886104 RepID=UPI002D1F6D84|nr:hypothetical protein [Phormidium sp. CCY1219]MEB3828950.1 hypothetical protein [Phormidium sp. CCY1219]